MASSPFRKKYQGLGVSTKRIAKQRLLGNEARQSCLIATKVLCDSIRSTLGPFGMYKMLSEEARRLEITKDGSSVITGLIVDHPAARLIIEMAKSIEDETGDGTTSTIILAGELISKAERLINDGLHPVSIVEGYKKATQKAYEIVDEIAQKIEDKEVYAAVARTSLKNYASDKLAFQVVKAIGLLGDERDLDYVAIEGSEGKAFGDTELIEGSLLHNWIEPGAQKRMEDARICIIRYPMMINQPEFVSHIKISASNINSHFEAEEKVLRKMVEKLKEQNVNVLVSMQDIDIRASGMLSMAGITQVAKIMKYGYVKHICLSTGANIVTNIWDLKPKDIGEAKLVEERRISEEELVFFEFGKNPRACTFFIRGGTPNIIREHKKSIYCAMHAVSCAFDLPYVVAGGGAIEIELARRLKKFATSLNTKEQLAVIAFAEALEVIPRTLAQNSGLDPIDTVVELTAKHGNDINFGVCIKEGETTLDNTLDMGIVEPLKVKKQMLTGAFEVSELILLTDGILRDKKRNPEKDQKKQKEISDRKKMEEKMEEYA